MFRKLLLSIPLATLAAAGPANAVLIDSFNFPTDGSNEVLLTSASPAVPTNPGGTAATCPGGVCGPISDSFTGAGIIGGTRIISSIGGGLRPVLPPVDFQSDAIISNGGTFTHSQTTGFRSSSNILWNANGAGLNANLLADGSSAFHLVVVSADVAAQWQLILTDSDSSSTVQFGTANQTNNFSLDIAFAAFSGIDFTNVQSIRFVANSTFADSFDTTVDLIETVPEPGTMTLLGLGLAGLGLVARRRRKA